MQILAVYTKQLTPPDRLAVYPITVDPIVQQAYLKASNAGATDGFGAAVAISDGTIIVGAIGESSGATGVNGDQSNNSAPGAGAVYVFVRTGMNWTQQAYLKASNSSSGDAFGYAVALSSDSLIVGAAFEDSIAVGVNSNQNSNAAEDSGAAYVFVRLDGTWSQQAYLKASNTDAGDAFGWAAAIAGATIVIGAPGESSSAVGVDGAQAKNDATKAGAAYVYARNGTTWSQQAYLKASNTDPGDEFGSSVSISNESIIVGAWGEDSGSVGPNSDQGSNTASAAGAAYVFLRSGGLWAPQAYLKASNPGAGDWFGWDVGISGDTVVIGAWGEDSGSSGVNSDQLDNSADDAGAAYIFVRDGAVWRQQAGGVNCFV